MQKVSKQSLAMIALSILLAISIALTFTFAALSGKSTAKGTITFSGNVTVQYDGSTTENGAIVFTVDYDGATVSTDNKKFTISGSPAYAQVTVTVANANGVTVKVKDPFNTSATEEELSASKTFKSTSTVNTAETAKTIAVDDIISAITFNADSTLTDSCTITIVVEADTRHAF